MEEKFKPLVKGTIAALISGVVGVVHGGLDSVVDMPGVSHEVLTYAPAGISAIVLATSEYGLSGRSERMEAGALSLGISGATTAVGYLVGRILVAGYKSVAG